MTTPLQLNNAPQELRAGKTAASTNPEAVANSSFFIIQPTNLEVTYSVQSGSVNPQGPEIPAGQPIPYPVIAEWNNNQVSITNTSMANEAPFKIGYYGMPETLNVCNSGNTEINQYGSTSFETRADTQTLTLKSTQPAMVGLLIGNDKPLFIALNVKGDVLKGPYAQLVANSQLVANPGNTYQLSNNFFAKTITLINVSTGNESVQVSLI